jgi:hypothetical protein
MSGGRTTRLWLAAMLCAAGACSADDGAGTGAVRPTTERTSTTTKAALDAYCAAALGFATVAPPVFDTAAPEAARAAQRQQYAAATLKPAINDLVDDAPEELESDADVVAAAVEELALSGAPEAYDNDTVDLARSRMHEFDLEHCELATKPVTMADFSFSPIDGVSAGTVSFDASNDGAEYHELAIVMKRAGVSRSFDEILALDDPAEQQRFATYVGGVQPVAPGEKGFTIVNLTPGEYLVACFLAVGSTPELFEAGAAIKGAPHVERGMKGEFRVG